MKTYFRILSYLTPIGIKGPFYVISVLLQTIFSTFNLIIVIPLLNILFGTTESITENTAIVDPAFTADYLKYAFRAYFNDIIQQYGRVGALKAICLMLIVSVFLSNIFRYIAAMIKVSFRNKLLRNLSQHLFDKTISFHIGYFTTNRRGDLMNKGISDVNHAHNGVIDSTSAFIKEPIQILAFFITLFQISVQLTLYTLIILPLSGLVIGVITKRIKTRAKLGLESVSHISHIYDEAITGIRIIKAFTAENLMSDRFKKELRKFTSHLFKYNQNLEMTAPISELLGVATVSGILFIGGSLVLSNNSDLNAAEFIGFIAIFSQVLTPAKTLSRNISGIQMGMAAGDRVFELIDTVPEIRDKENAKELETLHSEIQLKDVRFAYETEEVLKGINLNIKKGTTVALVGPSGGGKSTLADLIPRFYEVNSGSILIDGIEINNYKVKSYRNLFGIVTQESILFNDTIFNNIRFGVKHDVTEQEVIEAAKTANAHDFIIGLEDGYHTNIGEQGGKLSGGQKQRISIARALLNNPEVLILDEATSALDSESEQLVQEALQKIMQNRTSIVIAHRLSTIQHADQIVVLQEGQIVEKGNHQQLVAGDGLYKKLTQIQSI